MSEVDTPDAPAFDSIGWRDATRTITYRNYLLTLKWQLISNGQGKVPEVETIDQKLKQQTLTQGEVQDLIGRVRDLTPRRPTTPTTSEPLNQHEIGAFNHRIARAQALIDGILNSRRPFRLPSGRQIWST